MKNGDLWVVTEQRHDGSLAVQHRRHRTRTVLPADYLREHVQLGYATTVHRCQGMTVDVGRVLADRSMTREHLYTGLTRGRHRNHVYVVNDELLDVSMHHEAHSEISARSVLEAVLGRTGDGASAMTTMLEELEASRSLATLVPAYETALDPGAVDAMSNAVQRAFGTDEATVILSDESWHHLATLLYRHLRRAADLAILLGDHAGTLGGAHHPAAVLHWRLGDPPGSDHRLPPWIAPPPADVHEAGSDRHAEDAAVVAWLRDVASRIADRLDELTLRVAEHPPRWTAALPAAPAVDTPERIVWDSHIGRIVAYRDRYLIDADSPVGRTVRPDTTQGRPRLDAEAALTALGGASTTPSVDERERHLQAERDQRLEQMAQRLDELRSTGIDATDPVHQRGARAADVGFDLF